MRRVWMGVWMGVGLLGLAGVGWLLREEIRSGWWRESPPIHEWIHAAAGPDPVRYAMLKDEAERWRVQLAERHARATSEAERDRVVAEGREFLETLLPDLMRCWLGTRWAYEGHCETPGDGEIACGYLVATVLRDAGFRVDRYRLARQPAQNILRTFLPQEALSLSLGVPYPRYVEELRAMRPGVHLVGLDTHVGFLVGGGGGFSMIHASASAPRCVVEQRLAHATALARSRYRVRGHLTARPEVVEKWLRGERWRVAR
jgi:hypothetical protein